MEKILFSIVIVSLNAGEKLIGTLESIEKQTCGDYEVIIKDGGSRDGSLQRAQAFLAERPSLAARTSIFGKPDRGIYDGMNQAVEYARGEYLYFLNCGDSFHDGEVLAGVEKAILQEGQQGAAHKIYYGNIYDMLQGTEVASNPRMDAFACYRNVPCHQACFYHASLFEKRGYKTEYKVRGDYEHFLWCFFEEKAKPAYVPVIVADYEGGGYSETKENLKRSAREHREITALYMSGRQRLTFRLLLLVTLAPVRTWMAHNPFFSGVYNRMKQAVYRNSGVNFLEKYAGYLLWIEVLAMTVLLGTVSFGLGMDWDEAFTCDLVTYNGITGIIEGTAADIHPPFYYLVAKAFGRVLGSSVFAYRWAAIAGAVCTMSLAPLLIRKRWGAYPAYLFVLVMGMGPYTGFYNINVRMYSWALFFVTAAGIKAYDVIDRGRFKDWALFILFSLGGVYTFYFTAVTYVILFGYVLLSLLVKKRRQIKFFFLACAAVIAGYLPWLFVVIRQFVNQGFVAEDEIKFESLWRLLKAYFSTNLENGAVMSVSLIVLGLIVMAVMRERFTSGTILFSVVCVAQVPATYFISQAIASKNAHFYTTRYMLHSVGLLWLAVLILLCAVNKKVFFCLGMWLMLSCASEYSNVYSDEYGDRETLEGTIRFLDENIREGDIIIYEIPTFDMLYKYYAPQAEFVWCEDVDYEAMRGERVWLMSSWGWYIPDSAFKEYELTTEYAGRFGLQGGAGVIDIFKVIIPEKAGGGL